MPSKSVLHYFINFIQYFAPPLIASLVTLPKSQNFIKNLDPVVSLSLLNIAQTFVEPKLENTRKTHFELPENRVNRFYSSYQSVFTNKTQLAKLVSSDTAEIIGFSILGMGLESAYQFAFAMINADPQPEFLKIAFDLMLVITPEMTIRRACQRLLPQKMNPDLTGSLSASILVLFGFYLTDTLAGYNLLPTALPYVSLKIASAFLDYIEKYQENKRQENQDSFARHDSYETIPTPNGQYENNIGFPFLSKFKKCFSRLTSEKTVLVERI